MLLTKGPSGQFQFKVSGGMLAGSMQTLYHSIFISIDNCTKIMGFTVTSPYMYMMYLNIYISLPLAVSCLSSHWAPPVS